MAHIRLNGVKETDILRIERLDQRFLKALSWYLGINRGSVHHHDVQHSASGVSEGLIRQGADQPQLMAGCNGFEATAVFDAILRDVVMVSLHRAAIESLASENAARLAAMHAAERNLEDRLEELNRDYRRERHHLRADGCGGRVRDA